MSQFCVLVNRPVEVLADSEDAELLFRHRWFLLETNKTPDHRYLYAAAKIKNKVVRMHRFLLDAPAGQFVDHRNGDGLDNTRENIRFCTRAENARNNRQRRLPLSGFKGVYRNGDRWVAVIKVNQKHLYLGRFRDPSHAHWAYKKAVTEHFGEFAPL